MSHELWWRLGATSAGLAVALGAFGAHGLQKRVSSPNLIEVWKTASQYHLLHSIGIMLSSCSQVGLPNRSGGSFWAAKFMGTGIILFSGSLYAYVLTERRKVAAIAPVGGLAYMAGWAMLALRK